MSILTILKERNQAKKEQKLIKEIHDSFYGSVNDLLLYAQITKDSKAIDENHLNEASKLRELGFVRAKKVKEIQLIKDENALNEQINRKKELIKEDVLYFSNKYSLYKLITAEQIDTIISKYSLCFASVNFYTGDVPMKNLLEIENFKVDEKDVAYVNSSNKFSNNTISYDEYTRYLIRVKEEKARKIAFTRIENEIDAMEQHYKAINALMINRRNIVNGDSLSEYEANPFQEKPFMIVAPEKDFSLPNTHHFINGKIEKIPIKDPIVLKEVLREKRSYYLIVTAWGLEASDDLVKNEKYN